MDKPRIFLGSSGMQKKLLQALTRRSDMPASANARTSGVYWRADPQDMVTLEGSDERKRAELITERLRQWKSITNA